MLKRIKLCVLLEIGFGPCHVDRADRLLTYCNQIFQTNARTKMQAHVSICQLTGF